MKIKARFAVMAASVAVLMAAAPIAQAVTSPGDTHPLVPAVHSPDGIPGNGVGPEFHTSSMARSYSEKHLGVAPRGVNDFSCKVKPGDRPVILIPGTGGNAFATWSFYGPHLAHEGYCVYTFTTNVPVGILDEGWGFTGDVRASAQALGVFVDRVRKATGSEKVDLVGHSQGGGILPNTYIKMYGGASKVQPRHHCRRSRQARPRPARGREGFPQHVELRPQHGGLRPATQGISVDATGLP